jgi:hypothetical protein
VESFNGKLQDECLNANWFGNLCDVWQLSLTNCERRMIYPRTREQVGAILCSPGAGESIRALRELMAQIRSGRRFSSGLRDRRGRT